MKFQMFLFGCIGMAMEVCFVALTDNIHALQTNSDINLRLIGHSYIWMFFIYMWIPLAFHYLYPRLQHLSLWLRLMIYAALFIVAEFISGAVLDLCTGACPWDYTGKTDWELFGYARLDYFPFWMLFGFFCEKMSLKLASHFTP